MGLCASGGSEWRELAIGPKLRALNGLGNRAKKVGFSGWRRLIRPQRLHFSGTIHSAATKKISRRFSQTNADQNQF
jgi:hypothetical protein